MSAGFSIYEARTSGLHHLHPLTKLLLAISIPIVGLALPGAWPSYLLLFFVVLPLAVWGQVWQRLAQASWNIVWPFAVSVLLIQGLFWGKGAVLFSLGPLSLKLEGILFAISSVGHIFLVVSSFMLLSLTTRPDTLMLALTQVGLPGSIAYLVATTIQIVPRFQAKATTIVEAQRARGLETEGNILRRSRALLPVVLPLVLGSLVDVEERAIAIESRAFSARRPKTSLIEISDSSAQARIRWLIVGVSVATIVAGVLWR
jgi:energy-coupling factor transport system permease protein